MQKNAVAKNADSPIPKEVLNPVKTAEKYTFRLYPPCEQLSPYVDYYWIMRWDMTGQKPFKAEVVPSPYTNLTFMPEGPRITGVTTGKYTYSLSGTGAIVGAKFKPGGLYPFYHRSLQTLTDTHIDASSVFSQVKPNTNAKMLKLSDKAVVAELEKLLLAANPATDRNLKLIADIMTYLETESQPTVAEISAKFALSARRLQEIFQHYVGVGLKHIILRARLIRAATLAGQQSTKWTEVAIELGYSDQSHFINDFKRIVGTTPREYARLQK